MPPTTHAEITVSSNPIAIWVEATEYRATHKYPHNPAKNPESEYAIIMYLFSLIPMYFAASGLPPSEYRFLPKRVWLSNIYMTIKTKTANQNRNERDKNLTCIKAKKSSENSFE